jgi:hypothetical protein
MGRRGGVERLRPGPAQPGGFRRLLFRQGAALVRRGRASLSGAAGIWDQGPAELVMQVPLRAGAGPWKHVVHSSGIEARLRSGRRRRLRSRNGQPR